MAVVSGILPARLAVSRPTRLVGWFCVGLLFWSATATAASMGSGSVGSRGKTEDIDASRCPFPEELATPTEAESPVDGAAGGKERHPGLSFHDRSRHDAFDDHRYTTERHRGDRLSGTSRYSRAKLVLGEPEAIPSWRLREAHSRTLDIEQQMREQEPTTGWTLLRDGLPSQAILEFGDIAIDQPGLSTPRAGYALARAALGDLARGVRAMRAAVRTNVETLHCAPMDDRIRERIEALLPLYEVEDDPTLQDADSHFMRAALHYLVDDLQSAEIDVELAIMDGDESQSTTSLQRILRRRLLAPL